MGDDGCLGGLFWIAMAAMGLWFLLGDPLESVASFRGQSSYDYRAGRLENLVNQKPIGMGTDTWLVKGTFGRPDRVALFFGYADDMDACSDTAALLMERYPLETYYCEYADQ